MITSAQSKKQLGLSFFGTNIPIYQGRASLWYITPGMGGRIGRTDLDQ